MNITIKVPDKLKEAWDNNPIAVIAVMGFTAQALAKLIDARSAAVGRKAYAKNTKLREQGR